VLAGSQLVTWGLTTAWTLVVPRILGPKGIGELSTAMSATSILLVLVELGLTVLLVRKIAQDRASAGALMSTALVIQAVLFLPAVAVMGVFIRLQHFDTEQQVVLWLATAAMLPTILKLPFQSAFQATERMGFYALTGVVTKLVNAVAGIALAVAGLGVIALAALAAAVEALTLLLNIRWARPLFKLSRHVSARSAAQLAVESLPFSVNYIVHSTYLSINIVLLATFTSAGVVGWYGVSSRLIGSLFFIPVIVSTALLPRFSASFNGHMDALQAEARPTVGLVMALSLPIAAGAALVSAPLITLVYGPSFGPSAIVLAILLASVPFTYFNILVWQVLVASSRQAIWTKVLAACLAINIVVNLVLINYCQSRFGNGAIGAALALVLTEAIMSVAGVVILPHLFDRRALLRLGRAAAATALMAAGVLASRPLGLAAEVVVGVAVFAALALPLRVVNAGEMRNLYAAVARRRRARAAA
jgi:O-antigen/teichoic acid export membrane protein